MSKSIAGQACCRVGSCDGCIGQPVLREECYCKTSLIEDVERLADSATEADGQILVNIIVKYFFAYMYNGAETERIDYQEIMKLYGQFRRHRSLNEPEDDIEIMNNFRRWSRALVALEDVAGTAYALSVILENKIPVTVPGETFCSLDIGTGSGILMLAEFILGARNGFSDAMPFGIEHDPYIGERTQALARKLDFGEVVVKDPRLASTYEVMQGLDIHYISNAAVVTGRGQDLKDNLMDVFCSLFYLRRTHLKRTQYFPEGMIAYSRDMNVSTIVSREGSYGELFDVNTIPQGLIVDGNILPMHKMGELFHEYFDERAVQ
ncbi:MAG: hypothetical protein ACNI27_04870 [Desulfovibrio sp.]